MPGQYDYDRSSEMVGKIIMVARQIENQLQDLTGSNVAGIHAQTELAANSINWETQRQLHYIASVRNQAAHEDDFYISTNDFNSFLLTADAVSAAINIARRNQMSSVTNQHNANNNTNVPIYLIQQNRSEPDDTRYAVEQEVFIKLVNNIMTLGFFPFVGIIQLLFLLISSMKKHAWVVFLSIIYVCSIILAYKGWTSEMHYALLYFGAGCFIFAYICVSAMSIKTPIFPRLPRYTWMIPVVNIFYLPCRWARDLHWQKFLLAIVGLGSFTASIWLFCSSHYAWSFVCLLLSWASSAVGSYFWSKLK